MMNLKNYNMYGQSLVEATLMMPFILVIIVGFINIDMILTAVGHGTIRSHHQVLQNLTKNKVPEDRIGSYSAENSIRVEFKNDPQRSPMDLKFNEIYNLETEGTFDVVNFLSRNKLKETVSQEFHKLEQAR